MIYRQINRPYTVKETTYSLYKRCDACVEKLDKGYILRLIRRNPANSTTDVIAPKVCIRAALNATGVRVA